MNRLEDELKNCLQRKEPSPGFAEHLLERIAAPPPPQASRWQAVFSLFRPWEIRWVAISFIVCLLVWIGVAQYRRLQQAKHEGEVAKAQVMLALHIASVKLQLVQKMVQDNSNHGPSSTAKESQ